VFYQHSCRGLAELQAAGEAVAHLQGEPRGQLRINAPMSFGILHIAPAIPEFLAAHPGELARHRLLAFVYQEPALHWVFSAPDGEALSVNVAAPVQMNNSLALREVLLAGHGIARMPTFVVGADLQAGRLVPLLETYGTLEISVYLVYPHRQHLSPKVRVFVDFMVERIGRVPYWDRV